MTIFINTLKKLGIHGGSLDVKLNASFIPRQNKNCELSPQLAEFGQKGGPENELDKRELHFCTI